MSRDVLVEICVDDLAGVVAADRSGAHRVELCGDLLEGGTTPSMGLIRAALGAVQRAAVHVIVRPRGGDFVYSDAEIDIMCADIELIASLEHHTPVGIVVGALLPSGEIDEAATSRFIAAAGSLSVTFHKAFDLVPDPIAAFETLRALGVERILTSGGAPTVEAGVDTLAELVSRPGPTILLGGSVRPANVRHVLDATGAHEVHLRAQSPSTRGDGTLDTDPTIIVALFDAIDPNRSEPLDPRVEHPVVLVVDVGGTSLKGAIVDAHGRARSTRATATAATGQETLDRLIALLRDLHDEAEAAGDHVAAIGVATPGMVNATEGIVHYASTLDWTNLPLGAELSARFDVPVAIEHDVRSAGLAEALFGASAGMADSFLVSIGTGVAASIISGGNQLPGAITTAGELGHIPAIPGGELCLCGQSGCLEVYFSGGGLARRYAAAGGVAGTSTETIVARLDSDPLAARVWADGVRALTLGLTSVTLLLDPSVIVITGGLSRAGETLLAPVREQLSASLTWREAPIVRVSELGTDGGRIGAAVQAFRRAGLAHVVANWNLDDLRA